MVAIRQHPGIYPSTHLSYAEALPYIEERRNDVGEEAQEAIVHNSGFWAHITKSKADLDHAGLISLSAADKASNLTVEDKKKASLRDREFRCFRTTAGLIGSDLREAQEGDEIAIIFGSKSPFIVRRIPEHNYFLLIGDCYVHGIMEGEAMKDLDESRVEDLWFW